jgi:hypothetical protein
MWDRLISLERMFRKDYYRYGSVDRESQGAWRQDELIGGIPSVVK